ncbi:RND efflux system membrane fusion protein CmeA [Vibrio maritimus]|uniref:RND efflux system membrane fusion protein CmeA n=1 Tax=Vibrio maritimus TaxID=990268 RepID=A0A090T3X1_9VIBR|nr:RND efflux system membrane fusion protein CmeA [Vibrio maritimus]
MRQAQLNYDRTKELVQSGSATEANLDDANAALSIAEAGLAKAKASVASAQNDLWHTKIRAPYDGQLGKSNFSLGDMVSPIAGPVIDIAQLDPLNASFSLGEDDYTRFPIDQAGEVVVSLEEHEENGTISFIDNKVNASTGTLQASAAFSNQDNALRPNQVVRVLLTSQSEQTGFWLPQSAVMQDLMMQFIYVINDQGLAERREVEVLSRDGNQVFIYSGVSEGEQVITDGLVRVRPNVPVVVQ